jgi:uncharacterized protein
VTYRAFSVLIWGTLALQIVGTPFIAAALDIPSYEEVYRSDDPHNLTVWGQRYERGVGVAQNASKAARLYCKAARMGDTDAKYQLGQMYAFGRGVSRDKELAAAWLYQAAQAGDTRSKVLLQVLEVKSKPRREPTCPLGRGRTKGWAERPPSRLSSARRSILAGSGTGFVVNGQGALMTAQHVVDGCRSIQVRKPGSDAFEAEVVAESVGLDLAILKADGNLGDPAPFRQGKGVRPGDTVVVYGFPFPGTLATTGSVATGTVAALAGIRDDPGTLQISVPIQPGNSGGPVLDLSGTVVGVVSARLKPEASSRTSQSDPQNVNFATKGATAATFLEARGVAYVTKPFATELKAADVAELARNFTYRVQCYR